MQKKATSQWGEELVSFIKNSVKTPSKELLEEIDAYELGETSDLSRITALYQKDKEIDPQLEKKLLASFSLSEFKELGLPPSTYPKMLRGLPRFYDRHNPSRSQIKPHFTNLNALKEQYIDKALLHLYQNVRGSKKPSVLIFTFVMNDGKGDLYTALDFYSLIKDELIDADVQLLLLEPKSLQIKSVPKEKKIHHLIYDDAKNLTVDLFDEKSLKLFKKADLIVQIPTYFPETKKLLEKTQKGRKKPAHYEQIGQYGFIDSKPFYPKKNQRSMGLYFLEKGLLFKKPTRASSEDLLKLSIKKELFSQSKPGKKALLTYLQTHILLPAYLYSARGAYCYLYLLLHKRRKDPKQIDLVIPDGKAVVELIETLDFSSLVKGAGISEVELFLNKKSSKMRVQSKGKKLRLFVGYTLSSEEFEALLSLSEDVVAVRGDRSFTEALVRQKPFFYDPPYHSRHFLKDLASVANYYVQEEPNLAKYISTFSSLLGPQDKEQIYVEEDFFQKNDENLLFIAESFFRLCTPKVEKAMERLSYLLIKYFSCNKALTSLVKRALLLRELPEIEEYEKSQLEQFFAEELSFTELIENLRMVLAPHIKPRELHGRI